MPELLIVLGVIVALVLLIALWAIGVYNSLIKLRNNVDEAFSTMDVYLKKRYDLIPNLIETVKGYAKHESETFLKVVEARNSAMNASTDVEKIASEAKLSQELKSMISVVVEQYPDLKANQNFIELQNSLNEIEGEIANSRKYYNGAVKVYNIKIETVPTNIVAGMFGFTKKALFEVDSAEERKAVKVEF